MLVASVGFASVREKGRWAIILIEGWWGWEAVFFDRTSIIQQKTTGREKCQYIGLVSWRGALFYNFIELSCCNHHQSGQKVHLKKLELQYEIMKRGEW